jgi:succinate dehydrogenase/fumarate reductase cytochrome b subunit
MATAAAVVAGRGWKDNPMMRIVIVILVLAIIASLFSGLYFVYKDKGNSNRAVISLTIRIGLSLLVFAILMGSYLMGWIGPRGL